LPRDTVEGETGGFTMVSERVVVASQREEMSSPTTQVTSSIASSTFESSDGLRTMTHHPRDTMARKSPSFPPSAREPQLRPLVSSWANGQSLVLRHFGWAADHHATHSSSKSWTDSMLGTSFLPNRRPHLNHRASSLGRGLVGNLDEP